VFDVGVGELLVLMVLALLVFGPDKLPQVVAQATHWVRQLREQAASARADLADAVDLDSTGLKDLADLHPKRIASSLLKDEPAPKPATPPTGATFDPDAT